MQDGRIAFTFYNAAKDNVEVWSSDLGTRWTFHDTSLKPALPLWAPPHFVDGRALLVPYTVADRQREEGDAVLLMMLYDKEVRAGN
jgi:hypothetical protein